MINKISLHIKSSFIVFILCFYTSDLFSQIHSSIEEKIKFGLPKIERYYDSLSNKRNNSHLFYIEHNRSLDCADNYIITPLYYRDDLIFRKFDYYLKLNNTFYILDNDFDDHVVEKYKITTELYNSFKRKLYDNDDLFGVFICSKVVLNYFGCSQDEYKIDYSEGSVHVMYPPEPKPLLDYRLFKLEKPIKQEKKLNRKH
jgi:hypothetical protein